MPVSSPKSDLRQSLVKYAGLILAGRPYFRAKLRQKLFLRAEKLHFDHPEAEIEAILDDLQKGGYLDDAYLAAAFVRRQLGKGYGPKIITLKLRQLGLGQEQIRSALASDATPEKELASIRQYSRKFARLDPRKLVNRLYQRGYSGQIIKKVFDGDSWED